MFRILFNRLFYCMNYFSLKLDGKSTTTTFSQMMRRVDQTSNCYRWLDCGSRNNQNKKSIQQRKNKEISVIIGTFSLVKGTKPCRNTQHSEKSYLIMGGTTSELGDLAFCVSKEQQICVFYETLKDI